MERAVLCAEAVSKRYGGVTALAGAELRVLPGEVHALLGANGSGKSTLARILAGATAPDEGRITLDGRPVRWASPQQARRHGVAAVYQELSLLPDMTVAQNIWLAHEPLRGPWVRLREVEARTRDLLELIADTVRPGLTADTLVAELSPDERQLVEVLKALSLGPRVLILDEATASLDSRQVQRLFELVSDWRARGMAIVFISHRMEELMEVADRATVLRNGRTVAEVEVARTDPGELLSLMVGCEVAVERLARPEVAQQALLAVRALRTAKVRGVSLGLRAGEVLGLGGLQGQGQSELLLALFGAVPSQGQVVLDGRPLAPRHPRDAMRQGLAYVPGDRQAQGVLGGRSVLENLLLASWERYGRLLRLRRARSDARQMVDRLGIVTSSLDQPVATLSGGNQQKVVLGRWLLRQPRILLMDDPTKGVDVHTKAELYRLLAELRGQGVGVILHSSDDEELLGLCDRVLVMREGQVVAELAGEPLTKERLLSASMGAPVGGLP